MRLIKIPRNDEKRPVGGIAIAMIGNEIRMGDFVKKSTVADHRQAARIVSIGAF